MDRQTGLFAAASALYALSLVEVETAFVPTTAGSFSAPSLRGASGFSDAALASVAPWRSTLQAASTCLALAACAMAARSRASLTARRATVKQEISEFEKGNPTLTFVNVLAGAAAKKEQSVQTTKDVMKVKELYASEEFEGKLLYIVNGYMPELDQADELLKAFGDFESEVFPKFVTYLAKKKRLPQLKSICKEYVTGLYKKESIAPVRVTSAVRLTDDQKSSLKEKFKQKIGCSDVKLICELDCNLQAGFIAEWGFLDPETLDSPTEGVDLSLSEYLKKASIRGVPA